MPLPELKFVTIDYNKVKNAIADPNQREFNTSFHTAEEAPDLTRPSEAPYSFKRWLPIILSTRSMTPSAVQTITLTRPQPRLLFDTSEGSIQTMTVNRMFADDLEDEIIPILEKQLFFPPEGLFLRLDACSPKDGAYLIPGRVSLHSVEEVVLRLVTSQRARNALFNSLEDGHGSVDLFFLPFDDRMRSEREYRVYCPPVARRITAISLYQWHKPWAFAGRDSDERMAVVQTIVSEATRIHRQIVEDLDDSDAMDKLFVEQGFSFDLLFDEASRACELVELNGFGVRSSCGACLFQWVKDRDQLYGVTDQLEFRVTF